MKELKLGATIFVAVLLALLVHNLIDRYMTAKSYEYAFTQFLGMDPSEFFSTPQQTPRQAPATSPRAQSQPQTRPQPQQTTRTRPRTPTEREQVCNFWKQAYSNDNTDRNWQRVTEFCPEYQDRR